MVRVPDACQTQYSPELWTEALLLLPQHMTATMHLWEAHGVVKTPVSSQDAAPVHVVSLSHNAILITHQSSNQSMWPDGSQPTQGHLWGVPSTGSQLNGYPIAYSDFLKDNLKRQGSGLSSWRSLYLAGDMASRSQLFGHSIWALQRKPHSASYVTCCSISWWKTWKFSSSRSLAHNDCHLFPNLFQKGFKSVYKTTCRMK